MRITFVTPFFSHKGGIRVVASYARHLAARGHQVTVVSTPQARPGPVGQMKARLLGRKLPPPPEIARSRLLDDTPVRRIEIEARRPVTDSDVPDGDVVIATWWETAEWVAALSPSKGRKAYLIQDYEMFRPEDRARVAATYATPLQKIAVSGWIADQIATHHGIDDVSVLANAVDTGHFTAPKRAKTEPLTVGFLYTPVPRKNIALASAALELARTAIPGLKAEIFGARSPDQDCPVPDWARFHLSPPEAAIPGIYAACDLWLFTSHHEGFGLPLLEAMACRTPVLATAAGAAPDLIDGRNGRILAPEAEAFAAAMADFAAMPDRDWQTWSEAALQTGQRLGWETQTDALETLLSAASHNAAPDR
ncbi:MAG: glycosyltransferase family 4 protein [Pseudomonadota bacterium]